MKLRYVIVDDAPFIRELLRSILDGAGHLCVGEAGDGREGRDLVARTLPDVVFVDLVMPKKNGVALARELKDIWPEAKLVACTTMSPEEAVGSDGLFHAWISKPFTKESVGDVLKAFGPAGKETPA